VLSHATALPPSPAWADCLSRGGPHLLPRHSRPSGTGYRRSTPAQASRPARYLRFLLRSNEDFTPPHAGLAKESPELCPSTSTTRSIMETMRAVTDEEDEAVVRRDPPAERRTHDASGTSIARRCWRDPAREDAPRRGTAVPAPYRRSPLVPRSARPSYSPARLGTGEGAARGHPATTSPVSTVTFRAG